MQPINILLVEDNLDHVDLVKDALLECNERNKVACVYNGDQALDYLATVQQSPSTQAPDLILLDLKMPRCNGISVLKALKADPQYRKIPVIILSTSANGADVNVCYELGANSFVTKPVDAEQFLQAIKEINGYWVSTSKLPKGDLYPAG